MRCWRVGSAAIAALLIGVGPAGARPGDEVFTIANYPVDAVAKNAVEAKQKAVDAGRQSAYRALLKRLVPATAYNRLGPIKALDSAAFLDGVRVRSEENSRTQYIATLDYAFRPDVIRNVLRENGIPYVDQRAPVTGIILIYRAPRPGTRGATGEMAPRAGAGLWRSIWRGLDLTNSVAPLRLVARTPRLAQDVLQGIEAGDAQAIGAAAAAVQMQRAVVAIAQPDPAASRINVTVAGRDAVGDFTLPRRYRIQGGDFAYSLEFAAVIAQGVLEGRWKARMAPEAIGVAGAGGAPGGALKPLQLVVEFNNLGQWQRQQQAISETPGVRDMQIGGFSARSANVALRFPGGGPALQQALQARGLTLENINGFWIVR